MGLRAILSAALLATLLSPLDGAGQQREPSVTRAFLIEWTGATVGATVTGGAYLLTVDSGACGDDFNCVVETVGVLAGLSTVGGVAGLWAAIRGGRTGGSVWGGAVGALVGAAAGLVVADRIGGDSDLGIAVSLGLTQGLFTAVGARVGASVR
jgi:hypothetical protein